MAAAMAEAAEAALGRWVRVEVAAGQLGVSTRTIHRLMAKGQLTRRRLANLTLVDADELSALIERSGEPRPPAA